MTDQTSETTPDGLDVAGVRERYRRAGEAQVDLTPDSILLAYSLRDIPLLLAALDEARERERRVLAVLHDWCVSTVDGGFVGDEDFAEAIHDSGAWRFARDLRAALATAVPATEGEA